MVEGLFRGHGPFDLPSRHVTLSAAKGTIAAMPTHLHFRPNRCPRRPVPVERLVGAYRRLEPGMVLTVEPGIYLPAESIGIRIEDSENFLDLSH